MTLADIEAALARALPFRVPRFEPGLGARQKVSQLEDFMLSSALVNGDLVEARHFLRLLEQDLSDRWDQVQGWEVVAPPKARAKLTVADIDRAKHAVEPTLWDARRKAQTLRLSVDDQITRMEADQRVASRAYSMLSGT